jgi:hypothetical protein
MIVHIMGEKVTITKEKQEYVAKSPGLIGFGKTPREALIDWRGALNTFNQFRNAAIRARASSVTV